MPDLHLFLIDPTNTGPRARFTFGTTPRLASGIQALIDRWVKTFMTPRGTHPWRRDEGTRVPYLIGGNTDDLTGLETFVLEAIDETNARVRSQDAGAPQRPASERLRSAILTQFVQTTEPGIEFWVTITNIEGTRAPVLLPYAT